MFHDKSVGRATPCKLDLYNNIGCGRDGWSLEAGPCQAQATSAKILLGMPNSSHIQLLRAAAALALKRPLEDTSRVFWGKIEVLHF